MKIKIVPIFLALTATALLFGCSQPQTQKESPTQSVEAAPETTAEADLPQAEQPVENTDEVVADEPEKIGGEIILSTTTSTENSGLLGFLLPLFKEDTGIEVKVVAVGTGQAIQMGVDGEADVLLVHDTPSEEEFVAQGHSDRRDNVMYNDYVLIGPAEDPAGIKAEHGADVVAAFAAIAEKGMPFVSRGDDSGTHKMELRLWKEAGLETPEGDWYSSVGKGMGDTIMMAEELKGYTLSDRATYLSMRDQISLQILVEGDTKMFNQYGVIVVDPSKNDQINNEGAKAFAAWILSDKGQQLIGEFGLEEFGQSLFIPNAQ